MAQLKNNSKTLVFKPRHCCGGHWCIFQYIPWYFDRKHVPTHARVEYDEEEEHPNPQRDSWKHEWEIICGLYINQFINYNELERLGHRDLDLII